MTARKQTTSNDRQAQLERDLAEMKAKFETAMAMLSTQSRPAAPILSDRPMVGIRNISSYTVGLVSPVPGEMDVQLLPNIPGEFNPQSTAVISHAHWQRLRRTPYVADGMIMRDDSLLGEGYIAAPPDGPNDMPKGYEQNQILDSFEWIESRDEAQLKQDILAFKVEQPLHRLSAAVSAKIEELGRAYSDSPEIAKLALQDLPWRYQLTDKYVNQRLLEVGPWATLREDSAPDVIKY